MKKKTLITDGTGQAGSYLAELLLSNWCEVRGTERRGSSLNNEWLDHIHENAHIDGKNVVLSYGGPIASSNLTGTFAEVQSAEVYSFWAQPPSTLRFKAVHSQRPNCNTLIGGLYA